MNIILFGPPGAGKGTQAKNIVKKLKGFHVSTGEILRAEIQKASVIGNIILNDMNEGKFVSDEIVNKLIEKIVFEKNNKNKLIFDGYPRTLKQALNLDLLLNNSNQKINFIFYLNVEKKIIMQRIEKRKILEKRSDDNLETILKRYDKYMDTTKPVLEFYSKNANFYEIDGSQDIKKITNKINTFINV